MPVSNVFSIIVDRFSYLSERGYWEEFYSRKDAPAQFDWLASYDTIINHLDLSKHTSFTLLDVGCGISNFTPKLVAQTPNLLSACCVDFSHDAVEKVIEYNDCHIICRLNTNSRSPKRLFGVVADAKNLPFKNGAFDIVFDKGTTDSVLKGAGGVEAAASILGECLRVLTPDGAVVQVTDEDPDLRGDLLERISKVPLDIRFSVLHEGCEQEYFLYKIKPAR